MYRSSSPNPGRNPGGGQIQKNKKNNFFLFSTNAALGVHALSMLDTPTVVAIVFGTIFFVLAGLTAYTLYTCRRREQLHHEQQTLRQETYQSKSQSRRFPTSVDNKCTLKAPFERHLKAAITAFKTSSDSSKVLLSLQDRFII